MVLFRAFAFFTLVLFCSASRTNHAPQSHRNVKQQHETDHNANTELKADIPSAFVPATAPGRLQPQSHVSHLKPRHRNTPGLGKLSMQQDEDPQRRERREALLAFGAFAAGGVGAVVAGGAPARLEYDSRTFTDEQLDAMKSRRAVGPEEVMKGLTPSQKLQVADLAKAWMDGLRQTMSRMRALTYEQWQNVMGRANARMGEMIDTESSGMSEEELMDNGLYVHNGDPFSANYLEINTDQFMKQILLDKDLAPKQTQELLPESGALLAQNGIALTSEQQLEINTQQLMKQILLDVSKFKHKQQLEEGEELLQRDPAMPQLNLNLIDRKMLAPLRKGHWLNKHRKLDPKFDPNRVGDFVADPEGQA